MWGCSNVLKESKLTHLACGHIFELTKEQLNDHYYPSYYCPNCGAFCSNLKMSKDMEKKLKKKYPDARLPRLALNYTKKTILVKNTENGIRINLVVTKSEINKDNEYVINSEITSYLDFALGKQTTGKKGYEKERR